jgi:XrtN system VIT domain protein
MVFYLYLSFFVVDYYPIGAIGIILFGIGGHIFLPLTLLAGSLFLVARHAPHRRQAFAWVVAGAIATMAYAAGFVAEWHSRVSKIETLANQSVMHPEAELPVWVKVGQYLQNDWITERILKSNLVYTMYRGSRSWSFLPDNASLDEVRRHDPFVYLASLRSTYKLPADERIKILQTISDVRHRAQERLWSGDNLTTPYVVTDVDIYPHLRLAYTEKYFNVRNTDAKQRWWGDTQEAIYTFQLPEGSVVTALSLWIAGKEEKGILTSKQKATKAYKEIVGMEARDPSVVHWQEGNTVTVRVFPCTPDEERRFKIGITSPLSVHNGTVVYNNITFNGPNAARARATTRIRFIGAAPEITLPLFRKDAKGDYVADGAYDENVEVAFKAAPLAPNRFSFDGYTYSMTEYVPQYTPFNAKRIYLDINNTWTEREIDALVPLAKQYKLIVYAGDEFIELDEQSYAVVDELQRRNFSLFPFHLLGNTANTLVVTKGKPLSPHLRDFKDSRFANGIATFFAKGHKVKVYNLTGGTATYISTFRELRGLTFAEGDVRQLKTLLADKVFPEANESGNRIVLHDARMVITKTQATNNILPNNAPDHLARLFAYNDIMRKVGAHYFSDDFVNDALVDQAAAAYVVSPVSSLIVLETKRDYERFDIADKENSLHNAAKQSSGAVPEPHEWALIILFIAFVAYTALRRVKQRLPV